MTPMELDEVVRRLLTGWDDALWTRCLLLLAGGLVLGLAAIAVPRRRGSRVAAGVWLLVGAILVVFALHPADVIRLAVSTPYMTRIRVIISAVSLVVLFTTLESIRRTHLQERYALLWIATALVLLVAALFPGVVALFRAVTGTEYATAVVAVAFTFLVLVAFHFSIAMSATQTRQTKIAQRVAVLEARLKELEADARKSGSRDAGGVE